MAIEGPARLAGRPHAGWDHLEVKGSPVSPNLRTALDSAYKPAGCNAGVSIAMGIVLLYHFVLEASFGTTLGKAMMSLQVRAFENRGRLMGALLRNVLRIVDSIGFYLLGFLFVMFTQRGQRVGDIVAGTMVMEKPANQKLRAGLMALWLVLTGAAVWFAWTICPDCRLMMPR